MAKSQLGAELQALLEQKVRQVVEDVHDAALETELVGISSMRNRGTTAVTPTGSARQAGLISGPAGPSPPHAGRRETDQMYNAITGKTDLVSETRDGARIETVWGWEDPEDYYFYQEHGTDKIEPMEALHYSLHDAEDDLTARIKRIK